MEKVDNKGEKEQKWEEQQKKVAQFLKDFFGGDETRNKMVFVSNAPPDTRTFETRYYR